MTFCLAVKLSKHNNFSSLYNQAIRSNMGKYGKWIHDKDPTEPQSSIPTQPPANSTTRHDERDLCSMRKMFLRTGVITAASGSAYIELGNTKLFVAVHGPHAARMDEQSIEAATVGCELRFAKYAMNEYSDELDEANRSLGATEAMAGASFQPFSSIDEDDGIDQAWSLHFANTVRPVIRLAKYPKCRVDISVLIIENDGGWYSAAINAACAALCDAGIELVDIFAGCELAITVPVSTLDSSHSVPLLYTDPTRHEVEQLANAMVCVVIMPNLSSRDKDGILQEQYLDLVIHGVVDEETLQSAVLHCSKAAKGAASMIASYLYTKEKSHIQQQQHLDQNNPARE